MLYPTIKNGPEFRYIFVIMYTMCLFFQWGHARSFGFGLFQAPNIMQRLPIDLPRPLSKYEEKLRNTDASLKATGTGFET